ncbi:DUF6438 domain-containing protein [Yeosuana marina]|uniref:DUF6438 domain-containing protein n=1 Tax=Yeosuana marina TaxID=1565536 RepID=UPI001423BAB6|nr:DUF6438 domain-containing protein [Yeosuana marina]
MKKLIFLILIISLNISFSQSIVPEGKWISDENEMISFNSEYDNKSSLTSKIRSDDFYLEVFNDTLSFQSRYYTSADDYKKMITDRYDFKIQKMTDSILTIKPISKFSISFFGNDNPVTFKNQRFIKDKNFKFEKLVFHTSTCFGSCPVIHLEILKDGTFKLDGTYYKNRSYNSKDTERSGSFTGILKDEELKELNDLIVKSRITTFEDTKGNMFCCDGAVKTIILYHNGKRNYFKAMFEPRLVQELISFLYQIDKKAELTRTDEKFEFEK